MFSTDLKTYPLPERLRGLLVQSDQIAQAMARSGKAVPEKIMLYSGDFDTIARIVRYVTGGSVRVEQLHWSGRHLARYVEPSLAAAG